MRVRLHWAARPATWHAQGGKIRQSAGVLVFHSSDLGGWAASCTRVSVIRERTTRPFDNGKERQRSGKDSLSDTTNSPFSVYAGKGLPHIAG